MWPSLGISFLVALLTCSAAAVPQQQRQEQETSPDAVRLGNYEIMYCGNRANKVKRLLQYTHDTLSQLIQDLDHPSIVQQKALDSFMNGVPVSAIKAMFQHIVDGTKLPFEAKPASPPQPPELLGPHIVCIDLHTEALNFYREHCQRNPSTIAFKIGDSPYIFLCPRYALLRLRCSVSNCPVVDEAHHIRGPDLQLSQYAVLVHELIHFYYTDGQSRHPEIYSPNLLVDLPPGEAQWNPSNWGWFVASESLQVSAIAGNSTMGT